MKNNQQKIEKLLLAGDIKNAIALGGGKKVNTDPNLKPGSLVAKDGRPLIVSPKSYHGVMRSLPRHGRKEVENKKSGKLRRLKAKRRSASVDGFGNLRWTSKADWYLVELVNEDENCDRKVEIINYIACRQFTSEEQAFFREYIVSGGMVLRKKETVQSQYVLNYAYLYAHQNHKELNVNKVFIFNVVKEGASPAGEPLYVQGVEPGKQKIKYNKRMIANLKNCIYHPEAVRPLII